MVVVVVEPTAKSLEVGRRAVELVRDSGMGRVVVSANRVRDEEDRSRVLAAFPDVDIFVVPDDPAIVAAERRGLAPLDDAAQAPAVRAMVSFAEGLLAPV